MSFLQGSYSLSFQGPLNMDTIFQNVLSYFFSQRVYQWCISMFWVCYEPSLLITVTYRAREHLHVFLELWRLVRCKLTEFFNSLTSNSSPQFLPPAHFSRPLQPSLPTSINLKLQTSCVISSSLYLLAAPSP